MTVCDDVLGNWNCEIMDYVQDGIKENEYDFAEDAIDFEAKILEGRNVRFTERLIKPLEKGSYIVFSGTPSDDLPWFEINFGHGDQEGKRSDLSIHFNVRMPQCYIVRNTKKSGNWGEEETTSFRSFPFTVKNSFTIEVLVDSSETIWAVDGEYYCKYKHRQPSPLFANWIEVRGVRDIMIEVKKSQKFPRLGPELYEVPKHQHINVLASTLEPTWKPNTVALLKSSVPIEYQLVIRARLRNILHSFSIELLDGTLEWPPNVVLFCAQVKVHSFAHLPRQLVTFNTRLSKWGTERKQMTAKFIPGAETVIRIVRGMSEWSMFADDVLLGDLEYRWSPELAKALRIRGDLFPSRIYLCPIDPTAITTTTDG